MRKHLGGKILNRIPFKVGETARRSIERIAMLTDVKADYIIVGAGSAGCVLAARLSEDPNVSVLLLEAGGWDRSPMIRVPLGVGRLWRKRAYDWGYYTEPEPHADARSIETARGKVIGGSSSINAMGYVRGHASDYDRWGQMGLSGWSFADVLPYFKRAERWEDGETTYRGGSGPLAVRRTSFRDPLYQAYIEAGKAAGYLETQDYNGPQQEGFGWCQWTIKNGRRCSTAAAYLHPARGRANLRVKIKCLTVRVLIERGRAVGIEYLHDGRTELARAEREVLVAGGTINSPQLLMLSGIGAPDDLRGMGITPVVEAPDVGRNLQDHLATTISYQRREPGPFVRLTRADRLAFSVARAYLFGTGPATDMPSGFMGFLRSGSEVDIPDIQFLFRAAPPQAAPWFPFVRAPWQDGFDCRAILLRPQSRGAIKLRSADPRAPARILQNLLAAEYDRRTIRKGFRMLREVAAQKPLAPFIAREMAPGSDVESDDAVDAYIRSIAHTAHHPAGTCRMGADPASVVDPALNVRGVEGLRVIDASVMPDLVGGNINAAVIMIAEKASDMVLGRKSLARAEL
jgi:4-pyridoxate dehydrogenase